MSALVDGQLDNATTERAWNHVLGCPQCRAEVEREIWVKNRLSLLAGDEPAPRLVEMLHELASPDPSGGAGEAAALFPRAERSARVRRLTALALLGVGSVSAAVFVVATWGGPLGLEGGSGPPASIRDATPAATPSWGVDRGAGITQPGPRVHVRGTLEGWRTGGPGAPAATATPRR